MDGSNQARRLARCTRPRPLLTCRATAARAFRDIARRVDAHAPRLGCWHVQFPMNEIILRFDKMLAGRQRTEKKEMLLKDSVAVLTEIESEKLLNGEDIKRKAL